MLIELQYSKLTGKFLILYIDVNVDRITIQQVNREVFNPVYRCKRDYTTHINERVNTAIYE